MKNLFHFKFMALVAFLTLLTIGAPAQLLNRSLAVGDAVPRFSLIDQDGNKFDVTDYTGEKVLVIYFYPKDESMVCTKEACAFRDSFEAFKKEGAIIIGINGGTVASHKRFQQHYKLPFILLSDPGNKVYDQFGVKSKMFMSGRETFVVDLKGKIVYAHEAMLQGKEHADDALKFIKAAKNKGK